MNWNPGARLALEAEWLAVGDYWLDASNAHRYPGHELLNLRGRWSMAPGWALTLRLNNALDRDYADRADFAFGSYRYFPGPRPGVVRRDRLGPTLTRLRRPCAASPSGAARCRTSAAGRRAQPPRPRPAAPGDWIAAAGRELLERVERRKRDALVRAGAVLDDRDGRRRVAPVPPQPIADRRQSRDAHVERDGLPLLGERNPVERVDRFATVRGDQPQRLRVIAMRERHACVCAAGQRGGDAGHHLERNAVGSEKLQLLTAPPEDEWIAALQAHDAAAGAGVLEHQLVNAFLRHGLRTGGLAHGDLLGIPAREREHLVGDEPIVQDHVRILQRAQCVQRQQARIARARTDQHDGAACVVLGLIQQLRSSACSAASAWRRRRLAATGPRTTAV